VEAGYVRYELTQQMLWWCWECKHQTSDDKVYARREENLNFLICNTCYAKFSQLEIKKMMRLAEIKNALKKKKEEEERKAEEKAAEEAEKKRIAQEEAEKRRIAQEA